MENLNNIIEEVDVVINYIILPVKLNEHKIMKLLNQLHHEDRIGLTNFNFNRLTEFVLGRILLKKLINKVVDIDLRKIRFIKNRFGKLYLKNEPRIQINISHSENCIVAAISNKPIGIDVESVKNNFYEVMETVFTCSEIRKINTTLSEKSRRNEFLKIWTCKEAISKAIGVGLNYPLKKIDLLKPNSELFTYMSWKTHSFLLENNFIFSFAVNSPIKKILISRIELFDLIEDWK